jgi:hypothetical protein
MYKSSDAVVVLSLETTRINQAIKAKAVVYDEYSTYLFFVINNHECWQHGFTGGYGLPQHSMGRTRIPAPHGPRNGASANGGDWLTRSITPLPIPEIFPCTHWFCSSYWQKAPEQARSSEIIADFERQHGLRFRVPPNKQHSKETNKNPFLPHEPQKERFSWTQAIDRPSQMEMSLQYASDYHRAQK